MLNAQLIKKWGFASSTPSNLVLHAEQCVQYDGSPIERIVAGLGLAPSEQVLSVMSSKPSNLLAIEHLAQSLPSLREHITRIAAISRKLPYLSDIDENLVKDTPDLSAAANLKLDELNCAFIITPDKKPLLIFSDLNSLLRFSQMGVLERQKDPLREAIGQEPSLALASAAAISKISRADVAPEAIRVVSSSAQDNYWTPSQAKTEAERTLARMLDEALSRRATDIEIAPMRDGTAKVRIRIYGDMTTLERHSVLSPETAKEITNFLVSRSRAGDGGRLRKAADGQMTYKNAQTEVFIRASFIPADRFGLDFDMISSSLRLLPRTAKNISLKELNLEPRVNEEVRQALMRTQGLIVLAGPTNSGKSTTIAGVVGEHLKMFGNTKKRLSLEDPVERYLEGITQISVDSNFAELVRALLRHDPDLVWVGEIRDAFSAAACVRAATSGHVVLSTVHANNSILAFRAISNYLRKDTGEASGGGASLFDLAESVSLLIGQRLVKKLCPHCRQEKEVTAEELNLAKNYLVAEGQAALYEKVKRIVSKGIYQAHPEGCKHCSGTGYAGELPVNELLPASREVRDLFAKSDSGLDFASLSSHRVSTLAENALTLISRGDTEFESLFI